MKIEILIVPECPNEAAAVAVVERALANTGLQASVETHVIDSLDEAQRRGFTGSPSIVIDGQDPFTASGAPAALACRVYATPRGYAGVPALEDVQTAIVQAGAEN